MTLSELKEQIPDFGKDIRLNLDSVLTSGGAPGLSQSQISGIALACAYSLNFNELITTLLSEGSIDAATAEAARSAATIMAMNNVYYRTIHLMEDADLKKLPARLRMSVIGKPGIEKVDFELMSFAISAIAGCGQCLTAHLMEIRKAGISDEGAQSAIRIASVVKAAHTALLIQNDMRNRN